MKILQFPHPVLLTPCEEVTKFDVNLLNVLDHMWKTMKDARGLGLAANQVGISEDIVVINGPNGRLNLINPYISAKSMAFANLRESCLSAFNESIIVPGRAEWVQVRYQDEKGKNQTVVLKGIYSVCAQHEIDHLDGRSFMEHPTLPKATRKRLAKKWELK